MIKAIIFDCFGVLVKSAYPKFQADYLRDDPDLIEKFNELDGQTCRLEITYDEFIEAAARLAGIETGVAGKSLSMNPTNDVLFEFIAKKLKPNYTIGMLSNVLKDRTKELFSPRQQQLFDDFVLSFRFNIAKPNPEIYKLAAARLGVKPEECLFVDDSAKYCQAAREAGMRAIQYVNQIDFENEIKNFLN